MPQVLIPEKALDIAPPRGYEVKSFGESAALTHPVPSRTILFSIDAQSGMQSFEVDEVEALDDESIVAAVRRVRSQPAREWVDFELA